MDRPPAPGQRPAPADGAPDDGAGKQKTAKKKGGRKPKLYPVRALIAAAVILVLFLVYNGVRAGREALDGDGGRAKKTQTVQLADSQLKATLATPASWKHAPQQAPKDAAARYAFGPAGATDEALFVTRYELKSEPDSDDKRAQVRVEAERSLRETGAPKTIKRGEDIEVAGETAWVYRYGRGKLQVDVTLVLKGRDLYQLSCQSRPGKAGAPLRAGCHTARTTLELDS